MVSGLVDLVRSAIVRKNILEVPRLDALDSVGMRSAEACLRSSDRISRVRAPTAPYLELSLEKTWDTFACTNPAAPCTAGWSATLEPQRLICS